MQTAVSYYRFSSDNQRQESILAQQRVVRDYAKKNNIAIVQEYADEAISGTSDDRPAFQKMLAALRDGLHVDLVLVHKLDRFARNRYDAAVHRREIAQAGARLVAVDQPIDDSPEGVLIEGFLDSLSEYYSLNLAREVMKGLKETALQGKHTGGPPPLGYKVQDGRLALEPQEAEMVRGIFLGVLAGETYGQITDRLNRAGYRTRKGRAFGKNSLHDILKNEKYCGVYIYNRTAAKAVGTGKRNNHASKAPEEQIRIPGAIPSIVTQEEWEQVQEKLNKRKCGPRRQASGNQYLLTGKVFCAKCGSAMPGLSTTNRHGYQYFYYACERARRTHECRLKRIAKDKLESAVLHFLNQELFAPEKRRELADLIIQYVSVKGGYAERKKAIVKGKLADCQKRIDNIMIALERRPDDEDIYLRLDRLKTERDLLKKEMANIRQEGPIPVREVILEHLAQSAAALQTKEPAKCRPLVERYVDKIVVGEETVGVYLLCDYGSGVSIKLVDLGRIELYTNPKPRANVVTQWGFFTA